MNKLDQFQIKNLSFPDSIVKKMRIDKGNHSLIIIVDSALLSEGPGIVLNNVELKVGGWKSLTIKSYFKTNEDEYSWKEIEIEHEVLKDICEFEATENNLVIKGFGKKSGYWIEYTFNKMKLDISYNYA